MERTLILVKPDAFTRGLTGEIIARFESKGLKIVALRHMTVARELAERHYAEHSERPFFGSSPPARSWPWCWRASTRWARRGR